MGVIEGHNIFGNQFSKRNKILGNTPTALAYVGDDLWVGNSACITGARLIPWMRSVTKYRKISNTQKILTTVPLLLIPTLKAAFGGLI